MNVKPVRSLLDSVIVIVVFVQAANAVTIATVRVGSPGNAPDAATGSLYGAVSYNYRIGTYDVTNAHYADFLNAKASVADLYGLYSPAMDPIRNSTEGAIFRSASTPYNYNVRSGFANKPVIYVTWYDAVRFVNWTTNGQGNGDTESGTYTITGGFNNSGTVTVPSTVQRANWASAGQFHWLLPSENEWYKAAYYSAPRGAYYAYPFQSDAAPASLAPPGSSNCGNFDVVAFNYDGNGSNLTDVGAYPNSISPFGSFDMGGNVLQWDDTAIFSGYADRGGLWRDDATVCAASNEPVALATLGADFIGFRLVSVGSVPEPASLVLASLGVVGLLSFSKRFRAGVGSFAGHRRASGG